MLGLIIICRDDARIVSAFFLFLRMQNIGKILIAVGLIMLVAGIVLWLFGDKLSFLGRLPGDIRVEKENVRFYFPITNMILLSAIISLILWIIRKVGGMF